MTGPLSEDKQNIGGEFLARSMYFPCNSMIFLISGEGLRINFFSKTSFLFRSEAVTNPLRISWRISWSRGDGPEGGRIWLAKSDKIPCIVQRRVTRLAGSLGALLFTPMFLAHLFSSLNALFIFRFPNKSVCANIWIISFIWIEK